MNQKKDKIEWRRNKVHGILNNDFDQVMLVGYSQILFPTVEFRLRL
jgi:hypothetical protein